MRFVILSAVAEVWSLILTESVVLQVLCRGSLK